MQESSYLDIKCPNCGSSEVNYKAENQLLTCEHCGYTKELPKENDQIVEKSLSEGFSLDEMPQGLYVDSKTYHCNNCGSDTAIPQDQVNISCPFCSSTDVNEDARHTRVIQPAGLIGFQVTRKEALARFKRWVGRGWFHPNNLTKMAQLNHIHGVYLPFWTYDAHTRSSWTAMAGYYYYETKHYTDSDGNRRTKQVRKTRWVPASGRHEEFLDDVLVNASHGVQQRMVEGTFPFELDDLVNYDSQYLLGWECEIYQKDVKEGFEIADDIMDNYIRQQCARKIPGDTYQNLRVRTQKGNLTFKHILLPIWIAAYMYNNEIYQFLVNGQTGKVTGKKPYSWWKITLAVVLGIIVFLAYLYFTQGTQ